MSLRQNMLRGARRAPAMLGPRTAAMAAFLRARRCADGAFGDRQGAADLYYTVFALLALAALGEPVEGERLRGFLNRCAIEDLDLVHLSCLARAYACAGLALSDSSRRRLDAAIRNCRCPAGGYAQLPGEPRPTVYGCFLAAGALQDLDCPLYDAAQWLPCLQSCRAPDGGYGNHAGAPAGATPATAAAVTLLLELGRRPDADATSWLLARCDERGGFLASPASPAPDLLSTAVSLHALDAAGTPLDAVAPRCLEFVEGLWSDEGSFRGNCFDDELDCEYAFYGLLALGHLNGS